MSPRSFREEMYTKLKLACLNTEEDIQCWAADYIAWALLQSLSSTLDCHTQTHALLSAVDSKNKQKPRKRDFRCCWSSTEEKRKKRISESKHFLIWFTVFFPSTFCLSVWSSSQSQRYYVAGLRPMHLKHFLVYHLIGVTSLRLRRFYLRPLKRTHPANLIFDGHSTSDTQRTRTCIKHTQFA